MQQITEQGVRLILQEEIDNLLLEDVTENLFIRASRLVQAAKTRITLHGIGAVGPCVDVVQIWWLNHKPDQNTKWTEHDNETHEWLAKSMTSQIRSDAMKVACSNTGGS